MERRTWPARVLWLVLVTGGMAGIVPAAASEQLEPVVLEPDMDGVQRAVIFMNSYAFTPGHLRVQTGAPVEIRLENRSWLIPHNFIIDSSIPDIQRTVNVTAGESVTVRFLPETPGTYGFYCDKRLLFFPSHREKGMEGRLEVR